MADEKQNGPKPDAKGPVRKKGGPAKKSGGATGKSGRAAKTPDPKAQALDAVTGARELQKSGAAAESVVGRDNAKVPAVINAAEKKLFPVIGVGASAGGLEALEEFFENVPKESGMAFVVISHTDPARASLLPEIIQRKTHIPVITVKEGIKAMPNTVYLPPSNRDLIIEGDYFRLKEQQRGSTLRLPIDTFFKSLADSRGEFAACVILSGTGTDGTQGLRVIKEKGGVTVVQSTDSAKYEGMPESAIGTGLADFVLRPAEMPERLVECYKPGFVMPKPGDVAEQEGFPGILSKIIMTINNRTGHDFSTYKKSTLIRRVQRRMTVTRVGSPGAYLKYLHHNPSEIGSLFQDLLIGVTSFFRDPEAFDYLKKEVLSGLLTRLPDFETFRVWAAGSATGEEVYSVVMLVMECIEELGMRKEVQVFGTDLDNMAIEKAREGIYPENIAADLTPERLKRYFEKVDKNYRVRKELREPVVFATHNVLRDPPFSRLDLLICRNLLIYTS
jgi:two-component system CheB/CheR fusion protein